MHINALLSIFLLIAIFTWHDGLRFITDLPHFCLFEYVFGLSCPGCDITAALAVLAHFDVSRALLIQPCGVALAVTVFIQSVIRGAYLLRLVSIQQTTQGVGVLNRVFLALLLSFWIFRLSTHQ